MFIIEGHHFCQGIDTAPKFSVKQIRREVYRLEGRNSSEKFASVIPGQPARCQLPGLFVEMDLVRAYRAAGDFANVNSSIR